MGKHAKTQIIEEIFSQFLKEIPFDGIYIRFEITFTAAFLLALFRISYIN